MRHLLIIATLCTIGLHAQWTPEGVLANIARVDDPALAGADFARGMYAENGSYVIHTCQRCLAAVDSVTPDASHFLLVRAYTYRAMNVDSEEAADVWATSAIAQSPGAAHYLNAALAHFAASTDPHAVVRYERIRAAAVQIAKLGGIALKWNDREKRFE